MLQLQSEEKMRAFAKIEDYVLVLEVYMMVSKEEFRSMVKEQMGASHVWFENEIGTHQDPTRKRKASLEANLQN